MPSIGTVETCYGRLWIEDWRMQRRLLVAALLAVPLGQLQAQRSATWFTLGAGQASWGGFTEIGAEITASHQRHGRILTARIVGGGDILGSVFAPTGAVVSVQDVGVLAGIGNTPGLLRYSVGAGLGIASIWHKVNNTSNAKVSRLGVPLEGQLFVQPISFLGVGIYGYGDLNKERSFWGWSIGVSLGRTR